MDLELTAEQAAFRDEIAAFAAERARWAALGEFDRLSADPGHTRGNGGRPPAYWDSPGSSGDECHRPSPAVAWLGC